MPRLFPETIDYIIDYLHADTPSLCACGLTCRSWLASSRYHLFSNITVYPANGQSLVDLLVSSNNISPIVRHLTCALNKEDCVQDEHNRRELSAKVLLAMVDITAFSHMIKSLTLRHLDWILFTSEMLKLVLSNLRRTLEALELTSVTVRGLDEAIYVISTFPHLQSLSLDSFGWKEYPLDPPTSIATYQQRNPFVFKFLNLERPPPTMLIDWLKTPVPELYTVQLPYAMHDESYRIRELLISAGASIQEVEILFNIVYANMDTVITIDITKCTNIRSLRFRSMTLIPDTVHSPFVLPILAQVSSPSCEEVSFEFRTMYGCDAKAALDWKALADLLLQPQFANLKRVCVEWVLSYGSKRSDVEAFFAEGPFSAVTRRGLVQLKCTRPFGMNVDDLEDGDNLENGGNPEEE